MEADQKTKTSEYLKGIVANLPEGPGIYQYLNAEGVIIYVGKAKNLKRRVYSYFSKEHEPGKTRVLVSKIRPIRLFAYKTNTSRAYSKPERLSVTVPLIMAHIAICHR